MKRMILTHPATTSIRDYIDDNYLIDEVVCDVNDNPQYDAYHESKLTDLVKDKLISKLARKGYSEQDIASIDDSSTYSFNI